MSRVSVKIEAVVGPVTVRCDGKVHTLIPPDSLTMDLDTPDLEIGGSGVHGLSGGTSMVLPKWVGKPGCGPDEDES